LLGWSIKRPRRRGAAAGGGSRVRFRLHSPAIQHQEISVSKKLIACTAAAAVVGTFAFAGTAVARDQIRVVGSSTVYPFTTAVAEQFGKSGAG
jgi:hypothetical protein